MKRYETLAVTVQHGNIKSDLDRYGNMGWHVVAGFTDDYEDNFKFILQRVKADDATPEMAR